MIPKNKKETSEPVRQDAYSLVMQMQDTTSDPKTFCGTGELMIGARLRAFRKQQGMSIRSLAEKCGISVNTLSLIENDRSSPNVNTLKLLADGLEIPIVSLFEEDNQERAIVYQKQGQRLQVRFSNGILERLREGLPPLGAEPILVSLESTKDEVPLVSHLGREFIYCLEGAVTCEISDQTFPLFTGDSLLFNATASHRWINTHSRPSKLLVLFCAMESHDQPAELHLNR
ncbi:MAG: helix-turn-helix domain-containing protein [Anaerolineales bacterium]|jgi:transcriptional regulator with XRE-family HTH domain